MQLGTYQVLTYSCDQTLRLLFFFHHAILCDFYWRAAFIKLGTEDEEIHCLKEGGVAADARESIQRDTAMLATATYTELKESDPFADV